MLIRPETTTDQDAIRQVNRLDFGQDNEARLVDALRDGGYVFVEDEEVASREFDA